MVKHLAGIGLFILVFSGWIFLFPSDPLDSDEKLTKEYESYKREYEKLGSLIIEDQRVTAVNAEYVSLKGFGVWRNDAQPGFSRQRWQEYKDVYDRLPQSRFRGVSKSGDVIVFSSSTSACWDVSDGANESICVNKGFAYSKFPRDTVDSLDSLGFRYFPTLYKGIGNGWYIYRDWGISKPE